MRAKRKNYNLCVGEVRNDQELLSFEGYNDKLRPIFNVRCNLCKNEYISTYYNFKDIRRIKSSCRKCSNKMNKTYNVMSLSEAQISIVYSNYKSRAKSKNWEFLISKEEFTNLIHSNCHYCDLSPNKFRKDRVKNLRVIDTNEFSNGIDRLDSSKGYIIDNVVACCEDCNKAKRNLSYTQFLDLITKIYEFKIKK